MNLLKNRRTLPALAAGMGLAAMILRFCVYAFTTDEKGLLISGHPLQWLLWLTVAASAAAIVWAAFSLTGKYSYTELFPASAISSAGCWILASGIALSVFRHGFGADLVGKVYAVSGILAAAALIPMGFSRLSGKSPFFALPALVCMYFMAYAVNFYPQWSSHPQLLDSFFTLMSCVGLMLTFYQYSALCVNMGDCRICLGAGLLTVPLCMAAVPSNPDFSLFLCGAFWSLTNLHRTGSVSGGRFLRKE